MLTWEHKWKRSFGRCRRRWKNNIKTDVARLDWLGIDVIHLVQDTDRLQAVVDRTVNFKVRKGKEFLEWCRDSELLKKDAAPLDCCSLSPCAYWPVQIQRFTNTLHSDFLYLIYKPLERGEGGGGPSEGLYTKRTAETTRMQAYVHASSGIRTQYPSFRTVENNTQLRPRGCCDRQVT